MCGMSREEDGLNVDIYDGVEGVGGGGGGGGGGVAA